MKGFNFISWRKETYFRRKKLLQIYFIMMTTGFIIGCGIDFMKDKTNRVNSNTIYPKEKKNFALASKVHSLSRSYLQGKNPSIPPKLLTTFSFNILKLAGTIKYTNTRLAIVMIPSGELFPVTKGQIIGLEQGIIEQINDKSISVLFEKSVDGLNQKTWRELIME